MDAAAAEKLVGAVYLATSEADTTTLAGLIAQDFEFRLEDTSVEATAYVGAEGFLQAVREWRAAWRSYRATPVRLRAFEDRIVVVVDLHGEGARSGLSFTEQRTDVWQLRDSRLARLDRFKSTDDALAHVGAIAVAPDWQMTAAAR
jgi:ketosteroid isomerase-like protein